MRDFYVAGRRIADDEPAYVVAELGSSHCGDIHIAHRMIDAAAQAGVQAVKGQKRDIATFLTKEEYDAPYVNENSYGTTYGEHRERLELSIEQHGELMDHAHRLGLAYGCTAFDGPSMRQLAEIGVDFFKLASGAITDSGLLFKAHQWGHGFNKAPPTILSTGGATAEEIWEADDIMGIAPHALLHCTSLYPCPPDKLNLRAIQTLRDGFTNIVIGFSDHQDGIDMAAVAFLLGARIFEKHFTLDRSAKGTDHAMSLELAGMAAYVRTLRRIPEALGDGIKRLLPEEIPALRKQGRRTFDV